MSASIAAQPRQSRASSPWRTRIVGHADIPPGDLIAHPENWRRHPRAQRRALRASLGGVGWVQSVVVNRLTGRLVDGHARVEEALARGEPTVPVTFVELTEAEERLVLATLDPIGAAAVADPDALSALLAALGPIDADLTGVLEHLGASRTLAGAVDPDDLPSLPEPAATVVRLGQLWNCGGHRLLCGDALDSQAVRRLLAGDRPQLLVTDPPWGVNLDLGRRHAGAAGAGRAPRGEGHREVRLAGDERADWSAAFELVPSLQVAYVWHSAIHVGVVVAGLERMGFEVVSQVIWTKTRWALTNRWYQWQHEPCLVVRRPGSRLRFRGGRDQGTIWEAPSPKLGGQDADPKVDHPAQKPVLLFERPIRNHLAPGGLVYEPFLGSGTCLVAAELAGCRCLAMEIEPRFVQLAIERWQRLTGRTAVLVEEG